MKTIKEQEINEIARLISNELDGIMAECEIDDIAIKLYNAGYRKIDQTYEQLQEENARLYKMKRDLEDYIIEQGWQEYVGEETPKTVWHKVADGDLPKFINDLIIAIKCNDGVIRTVAGNYRLEQFNVSDLGEIDIGKVIAWAELPEYEGEE